jgi:hypothetical protein
MSRKIFFQKNHFFAEIPNKYFALSNKTVSVRRAFMDRLALNEALQDHDDDEFPPPPTQNYLAMHPSQFQYSDLTQLPIVPFEPLKSPEPCDSINRKLRQFHDSLNSEHHLVQKHCLDNGQNCLPSLQPKLSKSRSSDQLDKPISGASKSRAAAKTMPRTNSGESRAEQVTFDLSNTFVAAR